MADSSSQTAIDRLDKQTLSALLEASRAINDAMKPNEVCELVAAHAAKVLKAQGASVLLLDANRSELVFQTMIDKSSSDIGRGHRFPSDKGVAVQVIKTRRSVRIDNARDNSNF